MQLIPQKPSYRATHQRWILKKTVCLPGLYRQMKESRLIRYAKAGKSQAIASFLGNRLARFNIWVSATPNPHFLDLSLECLELPAASVVMPLIQKLLRQLNPRNIDKVKVTARFYGEMRAAWAKTFVMSEIHTDTRPIVLTTELPTDASAITVIEPIAKPIAPRQGTTLTSSTQLAIALNKKLGAYNVAAKIVHHDGILCLELRGHQEPHREDCLAIIYELLPQLELPEAEMVQVIGFAATQLVASWTEDIILAELQPQHMTLVRRSLLSSKEKDEFLLPLGAGFLVAIALFFIPFLNLLFKGVGALIFDLGHGIGYCLMGYLPLGLHNPFTGGGIATISGRSPLLFWACYGLWGLLLYCSRRRLFLTLGVVMAALWHGLFFQSTILTGLFLNVSGQVTLWILATSLFYCAFGGYSCRNQIERSLYMMLGTFFLFYQVELYWATWHNNVNGLDWSAFLGITLTLILPYLTYRVYLLNQDQNNPSFLSNPRLRSA